MSFWKNNYHVFFSSPVKAKQNFKDGCTLEYSLGKSPGRVTKWRSLELHRATDFTHWPLIFSHALIVLYSHTSNYHQHKSNLPILKKFFIAPSLSYEEPRFKYIQGMETEGLLSVRERKGTRKWGEGAKGGWWKGTCTMSLKKKNAPFL